MYSSPASALLLASAISTASAFVPMPIAPLPTDLDTNVWVPLTTLTAAPTPTADSPFTDATPAPSAEKILQILPFLDPNMVPDLRKRQGVTQAIAPPAVTQVSPITTYQINIVRNGVQSQMNVVYTQTFAPVPDQWPSPTAVGTIGLGTIQGEIGVVKTKRSLPTQAPLGSSNDSSAPTTNDGDRIPLLDKLRKAGKEIQEEFEALISKVKKLPLEQEDDSSLPLGKEARLPSTSSTESDDEPFSFGGGADEDELPHLSPEFRMQQNDARVFKAGTLAVVAVAIGTMCVTYL